MNTEEMKLAAKNKPVIIYTKKETKYKVLGVGKAKLESGEWTEGVAYMGADEVYYVRPYNMFDEFTLS